MADLSTEPSVNRERFRDIPEELWQELWEKGSVREYAADEAILPPGDSGAHVKLIISGSAAVMLTDPDGELVPVEILGPGDLVGEISHFLEKPSPPNQEVIAEESCQVLEIPGPVFNQILSDHPAAAIGVLRELSRKVIRLDRSMHRTVRKKRALQDVLSRHGNIFPDFVISETVLRRMGQRLGDLAHEDIPVLITGESGVGKEFVGKAIYSMSTHHKNVFLFLDLAQSGHENGMVKSDEELLDDPVRTEEQMNIFFGYEITGRDGSHTEMPGYVELAEEGTLLVRAIELITRPVQVELLRTLQTGSYRRVGGKTILTADFRFIGATNLDPSEISRDRHPLLYWLLQFSVSIAPLRKRRKEIPELVRKYVSQYAREARKEITHIPNETMKTLVTYSWPGNDRELATTLKRAILLAQGGELKPQDIYYDLRRIEAGGKINLLHVKALKSAVNSPLFPAIFQSAAAPFFFILLILLFLGPVDPLRNVGGLFSWAVGWPMMVFGTFLWARFWCSLCPMGTLSYLAKKIVSWELPFPAWLKDYSDWIAAGSVMFIIWLETATDIRNSPFNTGLLLMTILVLAIVVAVIFERQSWCRYMCPLGLMMGVFAKVSPVELRADRNICSSQCATNECYVGTADRPGCPFGQMVPSLRSNRMCKLCATCLKNCPHGAVSINLRIPGSEIWEVKQVISITSLLVASMLGGLISDLSHKMPVYQWFGSHLQGWPDIVVFSAFFLVVVSITDLLVAGASRISSIVSGETFRENFARYGLALLPLVLTSFMAYHLYYLIHVGIYFPIVMWENFHFEIFREMAITVSPSTTHLLQKILLTLGMVGSLTIAFQLARGKSKSLIRSIEEFLPHCVVVIVFFFVLLKCFDGFFY